MCRQNSGIRRRVADTAGHRGRGDFPAGLLQGLIAVMDHAADAERAVAGGGLLQGLDPRIKCFGMLSLILAAVLARSLSALGMLLGCVFLLAQASGVRPGRLGRQLWLGGLLLTGVLAAPALFLVPGQALVQLPWLGWAVTVQGARSACLLVGRAGITAGCTLLLVLTTPWPHVLKALRSLGMPLVMVAILSMTHRYVFVLLDRAVQTLEGHRSRVMGRLSGPERRRLAAASAGMLFGEALRLGTEVHLAMLSRGYRGEVQLLDDFQTRPLDWAVLAGLLAVAAAAVRLG
jgi:cobalt/nickel transport system permease protein